MNKLALLAAVALGTTALANPAFAATQVNGVEGCVMKSGSTAGSQFSTTHSEGSDTTINYAFGSGPDASFDLMTDGTGTMYSCNLTSGVIGGGTSSTNMTSGNFVTVGELNPILNDIYTQLGSGSSASYLETVACDSSLKGTGTADDPLGLSDTITGQINQSTTSITNLESTVDDHSQWIDNVNNGGGITYFHANSTLADSQTVGAESVAIGGNAQALADNAVTMGSNALASGENATAIGAASVASGLNSAALGASASAEADNSVALGANSTATRANTVSVGSEGNERQVVNVKAGTQSTDAVNVSQLKGTTDALGGGSHIDENGNVVAPTYVINNNNYTNVGDALAAVNDGTRAYTDQRVNELQAYVDGRFSDVNAQIRSVRNEMRGVAAMGMAAAGLRYDDRPGKFSIAGALGGYKGKTAMAFGLGWTHPNQNVRLNASLSIVPDTGQKAWNAGAQWILN